MKRLVVGLGNPILCDDAVGITVMREVEKRINCKENTFLEAYVGGLRLLDYMSGYDELVIIDSIQTRDGKPGELYKLELGELTVSSRTRTLHDVDLATAIEMGKRMGMQIPTSVKIYAIEVRDPYTIGEILTPEVAKAVPDIIDTIIRGEFQ